MRDITQTYSPNNNFWEQHPQFTTVNPFKKIWASDKSRGKKVTSDLMWAIALIYHPKSDLYYMPSKIERISLDMLKIKKNELDSFWEENKVFVDAFKDMVITQAVKSLVVWEEAMKDRDEFLSTQRYTFGYTDEAGIEYKDNTKLLDEMRARTPKMYAEFFQIKKAIEEEDAKDSKNNKGYSAGDVII
jgi:hypothetical protein